MDASIIVPVRASEAAALADCLAGLASQRFDDGRLEVIVAQYGGGDPVARPVPTPEDVVRIDVDGASPYAARNAAAARARGDVLLFTEAGCVPDPGWVQAHLQRLRESGASLCVGRVAAARETWLVRLFCAYEDERDAWVFSQDRWQHLFGRPKNMAIRRDRFASHGPFVEILRGADSKLVQKVARELSTTEIALAPEAVVRQSSVRGWPSCLRDRFRHSHALQLHQSAHAAPIGLGDRIRIFRRTVRQRGYGPLEAATLFLLVVVGMVAFRIGGRIGLASRQLAGPPERP